jgi:iron complex outermembrane receptor protein
MKKRSSTIAPALFAACGVALVPTAFAQQDGVSLFEEITVTATKREQNIYEVPIAISAFEGDRLAQQGIVDIVDVGKFVPNLNITQFSAGHTSSANPFIRGIGLQDHLITTDPGVSVYVDGVYLGRQVGQNWSLSNIERIEVLRGPQGTLYGRNSIGGAINIITKTPGSVEGFRVGAEVGSRDRLNGDFFADMRLSDAAAFSFNAGYRSRGGIGDFVNLPNAGQEVGETEEIFGRLAFKFENDAFSLVLAADANDAEGGLRPYTTLIDELPNGAVFQAGIRNSDRADDPYDNATGQGAQTKVTNEASGIAATAEWDWSGSLSSKVIASARSSEYTAGLDDDSVQRNFLAFPEVGDADQSSVEFQLNGDFGNWDFVSGLYWFNEDGTNFQDGYTFNEAGPFDFFLTQEVTSVAIFGNVGVNVSDRLRVSGGLRYTEDEKDAATDVGTGLVVANQEFDEISWDLSANYSFGDTMNLYGSIQSGYQSGQFPARPFCLFSDPNCFVSSGNITATNYEAGIKGQPTDRLQLSVAVFFTQYKDLPYQVSTTAGAGFNTVNLIVDQDSTGVELEGTAYFTENFFFHTSLGYIDVDVDEQQGVKPVAPLTPELTFSLSPQLIIPLSGGADISLRADYSYRDEMFGERSSDPGRLTKIDSRSLVNVDIAYNSADGRWTVGAYGRNVTDERYDNARLNTTDYVLQILSNDPSEFGVRAIFNF